MSEVRLSPEQMAFTMAALRGNNILVDACIGSGKTTAIQALCDKLPTNKKILYLTYNRLLKLDARSKITNNNATVTNYHGYAYGLLHRAKITTSPSDCIQQFLKTDLKADYFDVMILDEYQDIDQEIANMLVRIKDVNPDMQIIAVGDMHQKIYDKTSLRVDKFIDEFLGDHIDLEFTQCFRISEEHAAKLGFAWDKKIVGVNPDCKISYMTRHQAVKFLADQTPSDILCLGARTGSLSKALNSLEELYPAKFNKHTVYASIVDNDNGGGVNPNADSAIFTTFDSSKGLEKKICVLFDFSQGYWFSRLSKPNTKYTILRNIFLVAASRGKEHIIFVYPEKDNDGDLLSMELIKQGPKEESTNLRNVHISEMFDFKYKEDVEACMDCIDIKPIDTGNKEIIDIPVNDGLIDISSCIGHYQEVTYFDRYNVDKDILKFIDVHGEKDFMYNDAVKESSDEYKILFMTALETNQNRYISQVQTPYVEGFQKELLHKRLATIFRRDEDIQVGCDISFRNKDGKSLFVASGLADVVKDDTVYELKYVHEIKHEHYLQLACYMIGLHLEKGVLWNTRDNTMYEVRIPDTNAFLDKVITAVTKRLYTKYYSDQSASAVNAVDDAFAPVYKLQNSYLAKTTKPYKNIAVINGVENWHGDIMALSVGIASVTKEMAVISASIHYYIFSPEFRMGGASAGTLRNSRKVDLGRHAATNAVSTMKLVEDMLKYYHVSEIFTLQPKKICTKLKRFTGNVGEWINPKHALQDAKYNKSIVQDPVFVNKHGIVKSKSIEGILSAMIGRSYVVGNNPADQVIALLEALGSAGVEITEYKHLWDINNQ